VLAVMSGQGSSID
jgi:hypothetical protein